ncbi:MAG: hypothetical protein GY719_07590 [bacterium]|nr:hypothetical protein [bacterium]
MRHAVMPEPVSCPLVARPPIDLDVPSRVETATFALGAPYPDFRGLVDSTTAARLNGYLGGSRTQDLRRGDLGRLGLSEAGPRILRKEARRPS